MAQSTVVSFSQTDCASAFLREASRLQSFSFRTTTASARLLIMCSGWRTVASWTSTTW